MEPSKVEVIDISSSSECEDIDNNQNVKNCDDSKKFVLVEEPTATGDMDESQMDSFCSIRLSVDAIQAAHQARKIRIDELITNFASCREELIKKEPQMSPEQLLKWQRIKNLRHERLDDMGDNSTDRRYQSSPSPQLSTYPRYQRYQSTARRRKKPKRVARKSTAYRKTSTPRKSTASTSTYKPKTTSKTSTPRKTPAASTSTYRPTPPSTARKSTASLNSTSKVKVERKPNITVKREGIVKREYN